MNPVGARLKAVAVTALFFAGSAFCLLGVIWTMAMLPPSLPGAGFFERYSPHSSIAAVSDLRAVVALTSAYLVAAALVIIINAEYFDRMLAVFSDVLLMMVAAIAGFVGGYWVLLRLGGYENFLTLDFLQAALVCPAIVFAVSLLPLHRLRTSILLRTVSALVLAVCGAALLPTMS